MDRHLSPKQVARAIDVSESSVKRWCDQGTIPVVRTAGGHRRVSLSAFLRFLKETRRTLAKPESIGLPPYTGQGEQLLTRAKRQLREALEAGDEQACRRIVLNLYLAEHPIPKICDQIIAEAFHDIGERWECGSIETYQERRGCQICMRVINELSTIVDQSQPNAPVAIGATPEGDHYSLPTIMAETVLRSLGFQATSLGTSLPLASLARAVEETRPKLFWLSVSHLNDEAYFLAEYQNFSDKVADHIAVVVGGRALHRELREQMRYAAFCDNMQHLEAFAQTLRPLPVSSN